MPTKEIPEHRDRLGQLLIVGNFVAFPDRNSLEVGIIKKINPKMIGIRPIKSKRLYNKYPQDIVRLEGSEVTVYLLKQSS
jgi:hypothetical protein